MKTVGLFSSLNIINWKSGFYRRKILPTLFYTSVSVVLISVIGNVDGNSNKDKSVYNGNIASGVTERISILIGGGDNDNKGETENHQIGAKGIGFDGGDGGNSTGGNAVYESASWLQCRNTGSNTRSKCCYQYTWPGYTNNVPLRNPSNATCDYLRKARKNDETFACFDPLVYTESAEGAQEPVGTPPDFETLRRRSMTMNWNIYCPMTDKSCVTLTYYSRTGSKMMTNQTRFCGEVMNSNTGQRIERGCNKQNVDGYVREVCVCSGNLCNSNSLILLPSTKMTSISSIFLLMITISFSNVFRQ